MDHTTICHWNIRGFRTNYHHLRKLLADSQAVIACLQESRLPTPAPNPPRGFTMFYKSGHRAGDPPLEHGGTCLLIKNNIGHTPIQLNTNLQAVAARCHLDKLYSICSIYLPPNEAINATEIENIISQLTAPFLILGDYNARSPMWGDNTTNARGKIIETIINRNPVSILNNTEPTHFHTQTNSLSNIDLSICSSDLTSDLEWSRSDDLYNSDHFPVFLKVNDISPRLTIPKYIFEKADWGKFRELSKCQNNANYFNRIDDMSDYLTDTIITAANSSIPKTGTTLRTKCVPWWNRELEAASREKKIATRRYYQTKLDQDKITFMIARSKMRHLVKTSQKNSWKQYVSTLTDTTPINKVWKRVKKINGKYTGMKRPILKEGNVLITGAREVANKLGDYISNISKGCQSNQFLHTKREQERNPTTFDEDNNETYNNLFTQAELDNALKMSNNTAPGQDQICYSMIRNLPDVTMQYLLDLYNSIWSKRVFPSKWRMAIVLPFQKPGKDPADMANYRPIALTSCICKLLERMVNVRFVWFLENKQLIHQNQYGFRKRHSTIDVLLRIDTYIKEAFAHKEHVVAIFYDLKKAYDTTWRTHILKTLKEMGLKGNLPIFIKNFLTERAFQVRIGNELSEPYTQYEGVPQGSSISCILFLVAINGLPSCMPQYVESSLYVDDFAVFSRSASLPSAIRRIQLAANKAQQWTTKRGFTFNPQKTVAMHFTRNRGLYPPISIMMGTNLIQHVNSTKFLGLTLDPKLSWIPHLKDLKLKCIKKLDILKCLSRLSWGADRATLLTIYRSLIRSQLDYGCQIYASASKTSLSMLDTVHHQGVRFALGAFRTSPVESLYVESGEPSLTHRRDKLSLQLHARIESMPNTPAHQAASSRHADALFNRSRLMHTTFGVRMRRLLNSPTIPDINIMEALAYKIPPYTLDIQPLCPGITNCNKSKNTPDKIRDMFRTHLTEHANSCHIYTDGSKTADGVGSAAIIQNTTIKTTSPNEASELSSQQ